MSLFSIFFPSSNYKKNIIFLSNLLDKSLNINLVNVNLIQKKN